MTLRTLRAFLVLVIVLGALAAPATAGAADGEVLRNSSNTCGDVFKSGNSAVVNCDNLGDCPTGVSGCWVEIRWYTQCEWVWCTTYDARTGWIRVTPGSDTWSYCYNGKQRWQLQSRLAWATSSTKTIETWGNAEYQWNIDGGFVYRLIAKFLFNVTNNYGYRVGTKIATQTGTTAYAGQAILATSGGQYITLSC